MVLAYCAVGVFLLCGLYILIHGQKTIASNQVEIGKMLEEILKNQDENKTTQKN